MVIVTRACGTGENDSGSNIPWSYPANVQVDDANAANADFSGTAYHPSKRLYAHNFGFSIPVDATITDISFSYVRRATLAAKVTEGSVVMYDASGSVIYNNDNFVSDGAYIEATYTTKTYHGGSVFWSGRDEIPLTPALVNSANFGIGIVLTGTTGNDIRGYIQYISCTVTYTLSEVDFSIGRADQSPHGIVDEVVVLSEVKSPQWIRKYWAGATGKL